MSPAFCRRPLEHLKLEVGRYRGTRRAILYQTLCTMSNSVCPDREESVSERQLTETNSSKIPSQLPPTPSQVQRMMLFKIELPSTLFETQYEPHPLMQHRFISQSCPSSPSLPLSPTTQGPSTNPFTNLDVYRDLRSTDSELEAVEVVGKKQKDTWEEVDKDSIHYFEDVVVCLLCCMETVGYGDRRPARKSMKEVFEAVVAEAKKEVVDRTALSWERKFSRLK